MIHIDKMTGMGAGGTATPRASADAWLHHAREVIGNLELDLLLYLDLTMSQWRIGLGSRACTRAGGQLQPPGDPS